MYTTTLSLFHFSTIMKIFMCYPYNTYCMETFIVPKRITEKYLAALPSEHREIAIQLRNDKILRQSEDNKVRSRETYHKKKEIIANATKKRNDMANDLLKIIAEQKEEIAKLKEEIAFLKDKEWNIYTQCLGNTRTIP